MTEFYIRPAHRDEIISILSEHQIATKLDRPVLDCLNPSASHILICLNNYKLLVSLKLIGEKSDGAYEVHIACPRASIKASRVLVMLGLRWIVTDNNFLAKKLITQAPKGKILNFCLKLGFKQVADELIYIF